MWESLAAMSTGKVIALSIAGGLGFIAIAGALVGLSAILGPGLAAVLREGGSTRDAQARMPVSVRVLGYGVVLVAVGCTFVFWLMSKIASRGIALERMTHG